MLWERRMEHLFEPNDLINEAYCYIRAKEGKEVESEEHFIQYFLTCARANVSFGRGFRDRKQKTCLESVEYLLESEVVEIFPDITVDRAPLIKEAINSLENPTHKRIANLLLLGCTPELIGDKLGGLARTTVSGHLSNTRKAIVQKLSIELPEINLRKAKTVNRSLYDSPEYRKYAADPTKYMFNDFPLGRSLQPKVESVLKNVRVVTQKDLVALVVLNGYQQKTDRHYRRIRDDIKPILDSFIRQGVVHMEKYGELIYNR